MVAGKTKKKKSGRPLAGLMNTDLWPAVQTSSKESSRNNDDELGLPESERVLETCRKDPLVFGQFVFGWEPAKHHELWIDFVTENWGEDVGITAPPAFAKTNWVGIVLTAWYLGNNPDAHVIYTSKTGQQVEKISNAVRNTIEHNPRYHAVFPGVRPSSGKLGWGEKEWYLERENTGDKDPSFFAVGIGGPILNARGDLIIIDDPQDKTTSGTPFQRQKAIDYIKEQVMTRKTKRGRAVIIMTRWHEDDVAGYYKKLKVRWRTLPALRCTECGKGRCKCGQKAWASTWPSEWTTRKLLKIRNEDPILFEKVYQGNPRSEENTLFHEEAWRYYEAGDLPEMALRIQVLDTAQKEEEQSSYSVCAHWGKAKKGGYYLIDLWRDRVTYPVLLETTKTLYAEQMPDEVHIEAKASGIQLIQSLEIETGIPVDQINPEGSKWERARAISAIQTQGRCYLPKDAPWAWDFIEEHTGFPGRFTDQVDTTAHALKILRAIGEDTDVFAESPGDPSNRFRKYIRDTPDAASLDFVSVRRTSKWRKFSEKTVDDTEEQIYE